MITTPARPAVIPLGFLALMGGLAAVGPFSVDMYLPALPELQTHFATSPGTVQATLSAYFAGLSLGQIAFGPLVDRVGRRGPLLAGLALYVLASVGCSYAPSIGALIALRFLQSLGACAGMVVSRAVLRDLYAPRDMARVLSMIILVMGIAPIVAPMLGSFLFARYGWQLLFLILGGYGAALVLAVATCLPETLATPSSDLALPRIARSYLDLLRTPAFFGHAVAGGVAQAGMFAYIASSSFVFREVYHLTPDRYALLFGVNATGLIAGSQINARLLRRSSPESILPYVLAAFLLAASGLLLAAWTGFGGVLGVVVPLFCAISTLGFCFPNTTAAAMGPVGHKAGMASALLGMLQFAFAGVSSLVAGQLFDGSALPMACVIFVCACIAAVALALTRRAEPLGAAQ